MASKNKVMLMIDDAKLRDDVRAELEKIGLLVVAEGAENVIRRVFDEVPHLVVIDEDFRGGEGKSVALTIKEDAVLKYIPIVLLVKEEYFAEKDDLIDLYHRKDQDLPHLAYRVNQTVARACHELDLNPLTHLPGTRTSVLMIERAVHSKSAFSVCCLDLSDLAAFNSAYGDARGDEIIVKLGRIVADVLKREGASEDFLGHLGGDDFIVITSAERAAGISEKVIELFDRTIWDFYDANDRKQGYLLQRNKEGMLTQYPIMSVSVAIVLNDGTHASEIGEIGRIASELKKYMKSLPGSCYVNCPAHSPRDTNGEATLEVRFPSKGETIRVPSPSGHGDKYAAFFHTILRSKRIKTLYQPILDLSTRRVVGYEALTRSLDENFFSEPALIFALGRQSGRIKELDKICVDCALRTGQALPPERKLFLNLNHETLLDRRVMKSLFSEKGGIGYKNIVIEVTEQSILRSFERMRDALLELKEQGVAVAIDDVGGGAVSLRDVALLRPDYIKFDRSLIRQIDANVTKQQIVLSMILFANGIQAKTTAEGIETPEELKTVMMCGVNLAQGYYLGRPGEAFPEGLLPVNA